MFKSFGPSQSMYYDLLQPVSLQQCSFSMALIDVRYAHLQLSRYVLILGVHSNRVISQPSSEYFFCSIIGMLDRTRYGLCVIMVTWNVALSAGSSQQGNARRASAD